MGPEEVRTQRAAKRLSAAQALEAFRTWGLTAPLPTLSPEDAACLSHVEEITHRGRSGWRATTPEERAQRDRLKKLGLIEMISPVRARKVNGQGHYVVLSTLGRRYIKEHYGRF